MEIKDYMTDTEENVIYMFVLLPQEVYKFVGYSILDIGYSILENFLSPAPSEHSLTLISYDLTNCTVFQVGPIRTFFNPCFWVAQIPVGLP